MYHVSAQGVDERMINIIFIIIIITQKNIELSPFTCTNVALLAE